jgi:hypothetical protein
VPSPVPPQIMSNLEQVQDRLDAVEKLVMTQLHHPSPLPPLREEPVDEGRLADLPDAHLGAQ